MLILLSQIIQRPGGQDCVLKCWLLAGGCENDGSGVDHFWLLIIVFIFLHAHLVGFVFNCEEMEYNMT